MSAPVGVLAILTDHAKLWTARGNTGYEGDLILARAAVAELVEIAGRISYAHETGNCGASMGEAVLCPAYASQLRAALAKFGGAA